MKFNYEELEKLQTEFNGLYDKCNLAMGTIFHELRKILSEIQDSQMKTYVRWEFGDHLKSVDDISITKNGLDLGDKGVYLHMYSKEFEDGEFQYTVPYEWLELEDDVMNDLVKKSIRKEVEDYIFMKELKIKHSEEEKEKDLINRMKGLDKEKVMDLLNKSGLIDIEQIGGDK